VEAADPTLAVRKRLPSSAEAGVEGVRGRVAAAGTGEVGVKERVECDIWFCSSFWLASKDSDLLTHLAVLSTASSVNGGGLR